MLDHIMHRIIYYNVWIYHNQISTLKLILQNVFSHNHIFVFFKWELKSNNIQDIFLFIDYAKVMSARCNCEWLTVMVTTAETRLWWISLCYLTNLHLMFWLALLMTDNIHTCNFIVNNSGHLCTLYMPTICIESLKLLE